MSPVKHLTVALCALPLLMAEIALADAPDYFFTELNNTGGEGVTGGGDFAFIVDQETCELRSYQFDYATMSWQFDQIVTLPNPGGSVQDFCTSSEFGASSSSDGTILVVGAPGLQPNGGGATCQDLTPNERGGIAIYTRQSGTWQLEPAGNACGPNSNLVFVPGSVRNGDRFGESVSIGRLEGTDRYIIAVGSPFWASNDRGRVDFLEYDLSVGSISTISNVVATSQANSRLGSSVTVDVSGQQAFILVGGSGFGGGQGRAFTVEINASNNVFVRETLVPQGAPGSEGVGLDLSLSSRFAVASGSSNAYIWENSGTPQVRDYNSGGSAQVPTGGGDVTQSSGIVALGEGALFSGAQVLRAPMLDSARSEEVIVDSASLGGDQSDINEDIRLIRESLWFANPAEDRAFVARFPGGFGRRQDTAFQYQQISLPCDAVGRSVSEVFGTLGSALGSGGNDFDLYIYDDSDVTDKTPYRQLDDSYVFTAQDAAYSLWMALAVPGYVAPETCNGFSLPDVVYTGARPDGLPDKVRGHKSIPLPLPALDPDTGETYARVMVNNPFPRALDAGNLRYEAGDGTVKTLADAETADELSSILYIYDPAAGSATGQGYRPVTPAGTPPFGDRIEAHEGFWLQVNENAASGHELRVTIEE